MDRLPSTDTRYPSAVLAWSAVMVLVLIYACSFIDRQILSLLVEPIRTDLGISDTEFSLLHGFAFAVFYAVIGLPIGRLVDRGKRPVILAAGVAVWSVLTALCGLCRSFWQLFLCRVGVGVGEATVLPVTYSLVADYFPPDRRGTALGVFGSGVYLGVGAAMVFGGWVIKSLSAAGPIEVAVLGRFEPWQQAMLLVGLPGVALALVALMLYEPRKGVSDRADPRTSQLRGTSYYRAAATAIIPHHLSVALMAMALYSLLAWGPEHLRRTFDVPAAEAGMWMGLIIGICGTFGVVSGGWISDRVSMRISSGRLVVLAVMALCGIPGALLFSLATSPTYAYLGLALAVIFLSTLTAVGPAGVQELYPPQLRGTGSAIFQLVSNLIGLGLGPTVVALVTDRILLDESRLNYALAFSMPLMLLMAAACAWLGTHRYARVRGMSEVGFSGVLVAAP